MSKVKAALATALASASLIALVPQAAHATADQGPCAQGGYHCVFRDSLDNAPHARYFYEDWDFRDDYYNTGQSVHDTLSAARNNSNEAKYSTYWYGIQKTEGGIFCLKPGHVSPPLTPQQNDKADGLSFGTTDFFCA
jgi:hypothetical protein